ncbi:hypothetical protein [Dongia rigui]|uniref:Uncharacterized protein n=1 Tax=Dongia rigui TaxID=940149 RepID=A0ABU5DZ60_9PROT|nr:hypothetical protein [Dongia rigui]MDY0872302.1 hypothetical protein [Dongia rigui]
MSVLRQVIPDLLFSIIEINIARIPRKRQALSSISQLQQDLSYKFAVCRAEFPSISFAA